MNIKLFDNQMFTQLDKNAQDSPRRRSNYNIHEDYQHSVQRLFITLYPDSYVRPHKHEQLDKWEFFLMISGEIAFLLFDDNGICTHRYLLSADGDMKGLEIPAGVWHAAVPLDKPATFFEVKQGPYVAMDDKDFASWAPKEGQDAVPEFLTKLKQVQSGQSVKG